MAIGARLAADQPPADDDKALMAAVAAGDRRAFAGLVDRHADRCLRLATRVLGGGSDAEDVVQEAFLRVWQHAERWRPDGAASFATWLCRVVVNLSIDRGRRRPAGQVPLADDLPVADGRPGAEALLMARDETQALAAAVAALPERQRCAVGLCYDAGLSQQEAAAAMDVSVRALDSLMVRARKSLRKSLAGHDQQAERVERAAR